MECTKNALVINIIVATDSKWGISKKGVIPWKIAEDINYFQDVTKRPCVASKQNAVVMGKNTWLSLPKIDGKITGLKDRVNLVVSTTLVHEDVHEDVNDDVCIILKSLQDAVDYCNYKGIPQLFVCGGSLLYKEALETLAIDKFYLTMIDQDYKCDNFFPIVYFSKDTSTEAVKDFTVKDTSIDTNVETTFCTYRLDAKGPSILDAPLKNHEECKYLDLLNSIVNFGQHEQTRNSFTYSLFGKHLSFDLSLGFPLITTKKVFFRGIVEELLFFLRGDTNTNHLSEKGINIWKDNTRKSFLDGMGLNYEEGDMGPMYGYQLLHYGAPYKGMNGDHDREVYSNRPWSGIICGMIAAVFGLFIPGLAFFFFFFVLIGIIYFHISKADANKGFDQLEYCLNLFKRDPFSRRIMMTTYNPTMAKEGCLYPCHGISILFNVHRGIDRVDGSTTHVMSCMMTQRSADMFLGIPFNIASYALLVHILCEMINNDETYKGYKYTPGTLTMSLGNVHVYESHYTQCIRQIMREPYSFPQLKINKKIRTVKELCYEDIELVNYNSYPVIPAKMVA